MVITLLVKEPFSDVLYCKIRDQNQYIQDLNKQYEVAIEKLKTNRE